jgi:HPt (histidine-containing phosphotransfer) domain-containing protein
MSNSQLPTLDPAALQTLQQMAGETDNAFLTELIDCYVDESLRLLQTIRTALAQADTKLLYRSFHSLKSSSASLGAVHLTYLLKEMEGLAKAGALQGISEQISQVEAEHQSVLVALKLERKKYQAVL